MVGTKRNRKREGEPDMTAVFKLHGDWYATYKGRLSTATFNCKGAAQAWINTCITLGHWRA